MMLVSKSESKTKGQCTCLKVVATILMVSRQRVHLQRTMEGTIADVSWPCGNSFIE